MKPTTILSTFLIAHSMATGVHAQSGADFLNAYKLTTCTIPFDINAEGKAFHIAWGMDAAWDWDVNVNRGIAHIGKGNFETGRVSFQPNDLVTDNGDGTYKLSARQQTKLKWRCDLMKLTGTTKVNINCDHEALFNNNGKEDFTGRTNYQGKPEEWYKLIKASVQYVQKQGLTVVSVSPFNEPDYVWQQATSESQAMKDFLAIAKLIKADPFFDNIRVCGGNTLNCDRALPWYNYLKDYIDEGNTHQLAGELPTYSNFFKTVVNDGKIGTGDELHNVGEAIVGANYGMTNGIWWGFDSRARGQFCKDSNQGVRLGYAEDGGTWTSGAVYRNDQTNEIHAFIGSSERQAKTASYRFVSTAQPVFFNGFGPTFEYVVDIPGGTGYQKGQINAEKLIDITYGEDVPQEPIDGTYTIMNYNSLKLLGLPASTSPSGTNVQIVNRKAKATQQQWIVTPKNIDGDCSYWTITLNTGKNLQLDLLNWNLNSGAGVIAYMNENPGGNEQWFLKYAGDGFWYIINRYSNKALYCSATTAGSTVNLGECPTAQTALSTRKKYMWRFMSPDAECNNTKPVFTDASISAEPQSASIRIRWNALEDENVTYNVLRANTADGKYNTIARSVKGNSFLDNTAICNTEYSYKVVPVAFNGTRGAASDVITAKTKDLKTIIAQYQFDTDIMDKTVNQMTAALYGSERHSSITTMKQSGSSSLNLTSQNTYLEIPNSLTTLDEMTIAFWARWSGSNTWERVFDFGNSTEQYMFFTPSNGSEMRFVMKDGGDEQILTTGSKMKVNVWTHVAITITPLDNDKVEVKLYTDGVEAATSSTFTIKPSDIAPVLNYIGRSQFSADKLFKGYIDDFRIYNYALSGEEVNAIITDTDEVSKDLNEVTGIKSVNNKYTTSEDAYYSINGIKSSTSTKGINIIKNANGTTTKKLYK